LVRGNSITSGYYKRPDLNNDRTIFTEDGWFRTGDVGQFNEDGTMSIIDRVKNLVKLSGGEVSKELCSRIETDDWFIVHCFGAPRDNL
jgi:long-subunit acyl-CoA synthetase (AMP-forming)